MSDKNLAEHELTYTMRFARELDMFRFGKNSSMGACYHQAVTRCRKNDARKVDKCGVYCAPFIKGTSEPGGPVLAADLKNDDLATARRESALYGVNSVKIQKGRPCWEIMIGMPGSKQQMDLEVYILGNGIFWKVPVMEGCSPSDQALLCTGVHYLSRHPITQDSALNLKPEKTLQVEPYNTRFWVCIDTDKPKLFDEEKKAMQPTAYSYRTWVLSVTVINYKVMPFLHVINKLHSCKS